MSHRLIPSGKVSGLRFGQILIAALSHSGMDRDEVVNELFFIDNSDLKTILDIFMDYYEREAFKKEGQDD